MSSLVASRNGSTGSMLPDGRYLLTHPESKRPKFCALPCVDTFPLAFEVENLSARTLDKHMAADCEVEFTCAPTDQFQHR